jgi:hypothetical protein
VKISRQKISHGVCFRSSIGRCSQLFNAGLAPSVLFEDAAALSEISGDFGSRTVASKRYFLLGLEHVPIYRDASRDGTDLTADVYNI